MPKPKPFQMTGRQFKFFRTSLGLSQAALGLKLGHTDGQMVGRIERGKVQISLVHYRMLSLASLEIAVTKKDLSLLTPLARRWHAACCNSA